MRGSSRAAMMVAALGAVMGVAASTPNSLPAQSPADKLSRVPKGRMGGWRREKTKPRHDRAKLRKRRAIAHASKRRNRR